METLDFSMWTDTEYRSYQRVLESFADADYHNFHGKLVPNIGDFLGVRVPILRKLAREILKGNWRAFLAHPIGDLYEQKMIYGMVTALAKCSVDEKLKLLEQFIPMIDNWAVCDIVAGDCKFIAKGKERVKEFIKPYLSSVHEFEVRFAAVVLMGYYVDEENLEDVLEAYQNILHKGYYVKMAVAWGISVCYVKFPEKTLEYLKHCSLDDDTYHKTLRKICESNRVTKKEKEFIKTLKRT